MEEYSTPDEREWFDEEEPEELELERQVPRDERGGFWVRFRWLMFLCLYAVGCAMAIGIPDTREPVRVQMGFYVLGFFFFALGFFGFFYPLAVFSPTARWIERRKLGGAVPRMSLIWIQLLLGLLSVGALICFLVW